MTRPSAVGCLAAIASAFLAATAWALLGPAPAASAHATLLFATPAIDGAVPTTPPQILLVFDQPVSAAQSSITLTSADGTPIGVGSTRLSSGRTTLETPTTSRLSPGAYAVHWLVTAEDGDTMQGTYHFAVGSAEGLNGSQQEATRGATTTALLRWLMFAGLALSIGGLAGARLARRTVPESAVNRSEPVPPLTAAAAILLVATTGLLLTALGGGTLGGGIAHLSPGALMASSPARLAGLEVLAAAAALAFARLTWTQAVAGAALVVIAAEGLRAHPHAQWPALGAFSLAVHLLAASIWIGALIHVIRIARVRHRRGDPNGRLVRAYASLAVWFLVAVVISGVVNGLALIPLHQLADTLTSPGYGRWLLIKLALVTAAVGCAAMARLHLRRPTEQAQSSGAVRVEALALVAVLGTSAALTVSAPPMDPNAPLSFPPPASGPVYSVGGRAGWVGIGASASDGQLLVRLTTPKLANQTDTSDDYALTGNVTVAGESTELTFRRCGFGCFVAPVAWARGENTITLDADHAGDLAGGTSALTVAWPPRSAAPILQKVVGVMAQIPRLAVHERVTSDANEQPLTPTVLHLSGHAILRSDPYSSGRATTVNLVNESAETTTIALGFPGDDTYIELTVDRGYRIVRETLIGPNHLVERTFTYPE